MTKAQRRHMATAKILAELNREFWPHVEPAPLPAKEG